MFDVPDFSREAKVSDLHHLGSHAQEILGLHVSVEIAVFVHEGETLEHLQFGREKCVIPAAATGLFDRRGKCTNTAIITKILNAAVLF